MIVSIMIGASEKRSARSQYEPNEYSARLTVDQLVVDRPEELLVQASNLFALAKRAIHGAMRADGLEAFAPEPAANDRGFPLDSGRFLSGGQGLNGGELGANGHANGNGRGTTEGAGYNAGGFANGNGQSAPEGVGHNGNGRGKIAATEPQLGLIRKLASKQRLDKEGLDRLCQEAVGQTLQDLSKFDASRVITALKEDGR